MKVARTTHSVQTRHRDTTDLYPSSTSSTNLFLEERSCLPRPHIKRERPKPLSTQPDAGTFHIQILWAVTPPSQRRPPSTRSLSPGRTELKKPSYESFSSRNHPSPLVWRLVTLVVPVR